MTKTLKKWLICLFAALALVLMCAAWLPATSFAQAQTDSAPVKNLYEDTPKSYVSANNPTEPWFAKPASIELGDTSLGNAGTYYNAVQLLVMNVEGQLYSEVVYDISAYDYDFFTVTVGNRSKGGDGFTNEITYQVYADDSLLTRTSHPLAAYEIERLACKIPAGTQELTLRAVSSLTNPAYGECNWVSPALSYFTENGTAALKDMPVSGNNTEIGQEEYAIKSATLNDGQGGTIVDENAITGAIHGNYAAASGGQLWKFGADYDISGANYTRLTMDVGMLFNETKNNVVFTIRAIGGVSADLAVSPAMNGTTYHHFDVAIPAGTTKIQIWAQSENNVESRAAVAFCNATLYAGGKQTPTLLGSVTSAADDLQWGDDAPALSGNFTVGKATVQGTLALDAGQTIEIGTHTYSWTFTPADTAAFATVTGTVELTAGRRTLDLSGVAVEDASFVYDGTAHSLTVSGTLPEFVSVRFDGNSRTAVGTTEVIVSFVIDEAHADLYEPIPSRTAQLTVTDAAFIGAEDAAAQHTLGSGQDVSFTLSLDAVNASVSLGGSALGADDVTVNGRTVTFSANYLETLGEGEHVFTVSTDGGTFTLTITCEAARGCGGVLTGGGIAFTLLAAGAAVAIVLVRRRRTDGK